MARNNDDYSNSHHGAGNQWSATIVDESNGGNSIGYITYSEQGYYVAHDMDGNILGTSEFYGDAVQGIINGGNGDYYINDHDRYTDGGQGSRYGRGGGDNSDMIIRGGVLPDWMYD